MCRPMIRHQFPFVVVALCLAGAALSGAQPGAEKDKDPAMKREERRKAESTVTVDSKKVRAESFLGFGAQWEPAANTWIGGDQKPGAERERTVRERVRWMRMPIVRVAIHAKYCYREDGTFDFDSRDMKVLYDHLDFCRKEGIAVVLWCKHPHA